MAHYSLKMSRELYVYGKYVMFGVRSSPYLGKNPFDESGSDADSESQLLLDKQKPLCLFQVPFDPVMIDFNSPRLSRHVKNS